jgi:ubiquinone/menaquinone biosynthesis C-methylase UbiE
MIAVARHKAQSAGLDIDYRVASIEALPLADASVDVVLSVGEMLALSAEQ